MLDQVKPPVTTLIVGNGPATDTIDTTSARATPRQRMRGVARWLLPCLGGGASGLLAALAIVAWLALSWTGIYPGVRVGDVALGELRQDEAAVRIDAAAAYWEQTPITLSAPQGDYVFTRAELGLRYDRTAALHAAYRLGHDGNAWSRLLTIAQLLWSGADVAPVYWNDEAVARERVQALVSETDVQPRDGNLQIIDGRVAIVAPVEGRGLDVEAAVRQVLALAQPGGATALMLPVVEQIQPRINAVVLADAQARADQLLSPVRLNGAGLALSYDASTIGGWLSVSRDPNAAQPIAIAVEPALVRAAVAPLAKQVFRDPRNAVYEFDRTSGGFSVTTPAQNGRALDVDKTAAALVTALEQRGAREALVTTTTQAPALTTGDVARTNQQALMTYLVGPLTFRDGDQTWTIAVEQLASWLTIEPGVTGTRLVFNDDALSDYLVALKPQIDRAAVDATYTMDDGTDFYRLTGSSRMGRKLDGPAAFQTALAVLTGGVKDRNLLLPVADVRPSVTDADVAALEPERWVAVDLTAQRMHAMVGKKVVYTAVISSGKRDWETPTGTFYILYRVENETMTSASIGAEEYYRLENVLYTQYFTNEGHALHYSWWKTPESFGTPSSHGCISQTLKDSEYFWNFARVGTRVTIYGVAPVS